MAGTKKKAAPVDFRAMESAEIITNIAELRKELVEQYRAHKAGELPNPAVVAKTRRSIAKALTILAEKRNKEQEK